MKTPRDCSSATISLFTFTDTRTRLRVDRLIPKEKATGVLLGVSQGALTGLTDFAGVMEAACVGCSSLIIVHRFSNPRPGNGQGRRSVAAATAGASRRMGITPSVETTQLRAAAALLQRHHLQLRKRRAGRPEVAKKLNLLLMLTLCDCMYAQYAASYCTSIIR